MANEEKLNPEIMRCKLAKLYELKSIRRYRTDALSKKFSIQLSPLFDNTSVNNFPPSYL